MIYAFWTLKSGSTESKYLSDPQIEASFHGPVQVVETSPIVCSK